MSSMSSDEVSALLRQGLSIEQIREMRTGAGLTALKDSIFEYVRDRFASYREPVPASYVARIFNRRLNALMGASVRITSVMEQDPRLLCRPTKQGGMKVVPREAYELHVGAPPAFTEAEKRAWWKKFGVFTTEDKFNEDLGD